MRRNGATDIAVMEFDVVIPARYESTRLPGKALEKIAGRPLLQWVFDNARASSAARVVVATDDQRIGATAREFGAEVCITAASHRSGTDRLAEAVALLQLVPSRIVVNVQGDEPLLPAELIDGVAETLARHEQASIATACHEIQERHEQLDPNIVKVVLNQRSEALYFSRAAIPHQRDADSPTPARIRRHIGIYAYRAGFLRRFSAWEPTPLERTEQLEQLRAMEHGAVITVYESQHDPGPGIDTEADLVRFRALIERGQGG